MTMETGVVVRWLVSEGDVIKTGDIIFEVETDKTTMEVDALEDGTVLKLYYPEGAVVPVNTPVAYVGEKDERIPELSEFVPDPDAVSAGSAAAGSDAPAAEVKAEIKEEEKAPEITYDYDLTVIGAGPGGYVAALRAAQMGKRVVIIEKNELGGTCLNRGCIPTKSLYACAREWRRVNGAKSFGITVEGAAFDWEKINGRTKKVVKKLTGGVGALLKRGGVEIVIAEAKVADAHTVIADGVSYNTANVLIATGTTPAKVLRDMGDIDVLDTDRALFLDKLPESIAIVGGGVIGVEMANIFSAFGVKVTVIELMDRILPMTDEEISDTLTKKLKRLGVEIITGKSVVSGKMAEGKAVLALSDGSTVEAESVLEAVGRCVADGAFSELPLKRSAKGFVEVDDATLETSIKNVYAIGDITGRLQLAHVASEQGVAAVEHMFEGKRATVHPVPSCIFTEPEIAFVGIAEAQAKAEGKDVKTAKFPFAANGKALTLGETEGFVKVVADARYGEILGVHIIGPEASSLIAEAVVAMDCECTVESFAGIVHGHPTLAEAVKEAVLGVGTGSLHI